MVCTIGLNLKRNFTCSGRHYSQCHFSNRQWQLFKSRSGVLDLKSVCDYHVDEFGKLYSVNQKQCCNPLNLHNIIRRKKLKSITAQYHDQFNRCLPEVTEGRKLCIQCYLAVKTNVTGSIETTCNAKLDGDTGKNYIKITYACM